LLLVSCQPLTSAPTSLPSPIPPLAEFLPTQAPAPTISPTATEVAALSEARLKNLTYHAPQFDQTVALKDGNYQGGEGATYLSVSLYAQTAFGDLNGDGADDAAVLLAENGGGSGVFVSLVAVLNRVGQPVQSGAVYIDDRPVITGLDIQDGSIALKAVIHQMDDPMVSPSLPVTQTYRLEGDVLRLIRLTSQTASGAERAIDIMAPLWNDVVSGVVQVQGSMAIAPFENNLVLRLYDANGNLLDAQPFSVQAADLGGPATFDNQVKLPELAAGSVVWLELADLSMADGSPVALTRVRLVIGGRLF
jgi:hypothetical protein